MDALVSLEHGCIRRFCSSARFPTYQTCCNILHNDVELSAEYVEFNHDIIKMLYETGFGNKELIQTAGQLILQKGGVQALWATSYALNRILVHLTASADPYLTKETTMQSPDGKTTYRCMPALVLCGVNKTHLEPLWAKLGC